VGDWAGETVQLPKKKDKKDKKPEESPPENNERP